MITLTELEKIKRVVSPKDFIDLNNLLDDLSDDAQACDAACRRWLAARGIVWSGGGNL
jgi:hypothetical protein